jgi:hypothetical protein
MEKEADQSTDVFQYYQFGENKFNHNESYRVNEVRYL